MAHILRAESDGVAMSSVVFVEGIPNERGIFTADQLAQALERLAADRFGRSTNYARFLA